MEVYLKYFVHRMIYNYVDMALDCVVCVTACPLIDGGAKKIYLVFRLLLDKSRENSSGASDRRSDGSTENHRLKRMPRVLLLRTERKIKV